MGRGPGTLLPLGLVLGTRASFTQLLDRHARHSSIWSFHSLPWGTCVCPHARNIPHFHVHRQSLHHTNIMAHTKAVSIVTGNYHFTNNGLLSFLNAAWRNTPPLSSVKVSCFHRRVPLLQRTSALLHNMLVVKISHKQVDCSDRTNVGLLFIVTCLEHFNSLNYSVCIGTTCQSMRLVMLPPEHSHCHNMNFAFTMKFSAPRAEPAL